MYEYFYRLDENGNAVILHCEDGAPVTRMGDIYPVYPVGSSISATYDHPKGIVLSESDAISLGIERE